MSGKFVLPFKLQFQPVVLPVEIEDNKLKMLSLDDLRKNGKFDMANWLESAENVWEKNATKTSLKNFPNALDRLNYHNLLIIQGQNPRYLVIYTASGTHIAATVVDTKKIHSLKIGNAKISPKGFIVDYTTLWIGTHDSKEAYYLAAILNSNTLDKMIKKYQPRGKFGPRHICRLPFKFNIPNFDPENGLHKQLMTIGLKATKEAANLKKMSRLKTKASIPSMKDIDDLVSELLEKK